MGPITSIAAGFALALGAVALLRAVERRAKTAKKKVDDLAAGARTIDFEFDQTSGAYRAK